MVDNYYFSQIHFMSFKKIGKQYKLTLLNTNFYEKIINIKLKCLT